MQRKGSAATAAVALLTLTGCIGTTYVPQVRHDYATALLDRRAYVHVIAPKIRAISLRPPFACDARTLALARRGFGPTEEPPEEIEGFASFESVYTRGLWAVRTVSGPDFEPGPWLYVETGTESDHPAMSAINVVNRYNEVAKCVARDEGRR